MQHWATIASLIETCKANGVEPYAYLKHLFTALPHAQTADDYEALLPWHLRAEARTTLRSLGHASTHPNSL